MISLETKKIRIKNKEKITLKDFLKKPEVKLENVLEYTQIAASLSDEEARFIESEIKYEGYLKKQKKEITRMAKIDKEKIPKTIKFKEIPGLTREAMEKLERFSPQTIGEAKRIPGITPASIINLHIHITLQKKRKIVPRETIRRNG